MELLQSGDDIVDKSVVFLPLTCILWYLYIMTCIQVSGKKTTLLSTRFMVYFEVFACIWELGIDVSVLATKTLDGRVDKWFSRS